MKVIYGRGYVYSLRYHIVFCVKYRHKVLINERALRIKEMFSKIAEDRKLLQTILTRKKNEVTKNDSFEGL